MMILNHDDADARLRLPLPPTVFAPTWAVDMDVYVRFTRAMRDCVITKQEQKILVAITTVATQMANELTAPDVARILVSLGLRAPRGAFPADFVTLVLDAHLRHMRRGDAFGADLADLLALWGLPVKGARRAPAAGPGAGFEIGSIPRALRSIQASLQQNPLGLLPEPVL
jgi:hypothetical protein